MSLVKTNAIRQLDQQKVSYQMYTYESGDGKIDGVSVASKIGMNPEVVYKTLVTYANAKNLYVFVIPVEAELDLKKAAKVTGEKKVEMIPAKDIQKWTGYVRGGCSPIGMKKLLPTFLDSSANRYESIVVSGGKIGIQIEVSVADLLSLVSGKLEDIVKPK